MSSLKIEERFSVHAPVERVWRFLLDPEQIAPCLPGAELLQIENERTFHGQMKVKVGPVTVAYQGTIELTEIDEAGRRVQMVGKGKEKGGAGSAKMTMESRLEAQPDGSVAVAVTSDVELAGRIVRFGRGMIQSVSAQLFKQFAGNVRQALESAGAGAGAAEVAASPAAGAEAAPAAETAPAAEAAEAAEAAPAAAAAEDVQTTPAGQEQPAAESAGEAAAAAPAAGAQEAPATPAAADAAESKAELAARAPEPAAAAASAPSAPSERATAPAVAAPATSPSAARASEPAAAPRAAQAQPGRTGRELAPREAEPVRALPLLFRALWDVISGFFKRLLGRR